MNSRQRRVDRRYWKYSVSVIAKDYDQYLEMWDWLVARHGKKINKCGWRHFDGWEYVDPGHISDRIRIRWQFTNEKNALAFALAWAGD